MKVSIITPSYNQGQFIEKTILSVLCQDYPEIEYIVVDAVSKDSTIQILDRYHDLIDRVIVESDKGQSDALNKGFRLATGDILAYLNSDDVYANSRVVSSAVQHLQSSGADAVVGGRYIISETGHFINAFPNRSFDRDILVWCDYIPQECVFWTRDIFERSGAYVGKDFDFAMDYELWFRFLDHQAKFVMVDEPYGLFRYYANQKSVALWQEKGLPEIKRLHEKYNGAAIAEADMHNLFWQYVYGVNPMQHFDAHSTYNSLWRCLIDFEIKLLSKGPLDDWVYHQPLRPHFDRALVSS